MRNWTKTAKSDILPEWVSGLAIGLIPLWIFLLKKVAKPAYCRYIWQLESSSCCCQRQYPRHTALAAEWLIKPRTNMAQSASSMWRPGWSRTSLETLENGPTSQTESAEPLVDTPGTEPWQGVGYRKLGLGKGTSIKPWRIWVLGRSWLSILSMASSLLSGFERNLADLGSWRQRIQSPLEESILQRPYHDCDGLVTKPSLSELGLKRRP